MKESLLQKYYHLVRNLMSKLKNVQIEHIQQEHNVKFDMLSRLATVKKKGLHRSVIYINIRNSSVSTDECMAIDERRCTRGKEKEATNHSIYPHWLWSLTSRIHSTIVEMYITKSSRLCHVWNTWRRMWKSFKSKKNGCKVLKAGTTSWSCKATAKTLFENA